MGVFQVRKSDNWRRTLANVLRVPLMVARAGLIQPLRTLIGVVVSATYIGGMSYIVAFHPNFPN